MIFTQCRYDSKSILNEFKILFPFNLDICLDALYHLRSSSQINYKEKPNSHVSEIIDFAKRLEECFAPIAKSLDALAYVLGEDMVLFKKYIHQFYDMDESRPKSHTVTETSDITLHQNTRKLYCLNSAASKAEDLIENIISGKATIDDINVKSYAEIHDIDLEAEARHLESFAAWRFHRAPSINIAEAYIATIELFMIAEELKTLKEVCEQFELTSVTNDQVMMELINIADQLCIFERRKSFTIQHAIEIIAHIKHVLYIKDEQPSKSHIFLLFKGLKESKSFFQFAKERGFTNEQGYRKFKEQHQLVTKEFSNENYHDMVLDHLLGAFRFFKPFFMEPASLDDLMKEIALLQHIPDAVSQIQTVIRNVALIRLWFNSTEVKKERKKESKKERKRARGEREAMWFKIFMMILYTLIMVHTFRPILYNIILYNIVICIIYWYCTLITGWSMDSW